MEAENAAVGAVVGGLVTPEIVAVPMVDTVWFILIRTIWVSDEYVELSLAHGMERAATWQSIML